MFMVLMALLATQKYNTVRHNDSLMTNITNGNWQKKSGSELTEKNYENSQYSRYFGAGSKHEH